MLSDDETWRVIEGKWQESPPEEVDHVIADPPFSEHVHSKPMRHGGQSPGGFYETELSFDAVKPDKITQRILAIARRWVICFCSMEHIGEFADAAGKSWVRGMIWDKPNSTPQFTGDRPAMWGESIAVMHNPVKKRWNGGGKRGQYTYSTCRKDRHHETQKPLPLMIELVEDFTDPGELVWDPYCGSGTTGVACLLTGRRFLGHEMQPRYAEIARDRLTATEQGLTLDGFYAGQTSLFGETK